MGRSAAELAGTSNDAFGMEVMVGEDEDQYLARQAQIQADAKARMAAKFGGGGDMGMGSGSGGMAAQSMGSGGYQPQQQQQQQSYGQPPARGSGPADPGRPLSQAATTQLLLSSAHIPPRMRALIDSDRNNAECADCTTKNPTWASYNIGIFICEKCCGVHRRIGTHISKPRSVDLDDWNEDHLEAMEIVGNTNADAYWCYNVPFGRTKPEEGDAMVVVSEWIQSKYERKLYCKQPGSSNERSDPGVEAYQKGGWMEKSGGAKEGGKWQARYFELKDFQLAYYKEQPIPGKKSVPKGIISITPDVQISCATSLGIKGEAVQDRMIEGNGFVVRSTEGRDYHFRTDTSEALVDWIVNLRGVRAYSNTQNARHATDIAFSGAFLCCFYAVFVLCLYCFVLFNAVPVHVLC